MPFRSPLPRRAVACRRRCTRSPRARAISFLGDEVAVLAIAFRAKAELGHFGVAADPDGRRPPDARAVAVRRAPRRPCAHEADPRGGLAAPGRHLRRAGVVSGGPARAARRPARLWDVALAARVVRAGPVARDRRPAAEGPGHPAERPGVRGGRWPVPRRAARRPLRVPRAPRHRRGLVRGALLGAARAAARPRPSGPRQVVRLGRRVRGRAPHRAPAAPARDRHPGRVLRDHPRRGQRCGDLLRDDRTARRSPRLRPAGPLDGVGHARSRARWRASSPRGSGPRPSSRPAASGCASRSLPSA